jgi:galactokinase
MTKFPIRGERFLLRQRALHVFGEAIRVLKFMDLLASPPAQSEEETKTLLQNLGALLNETQESCREIYDCSCPEIDELCSLARSVGAYGSRLTGAGWGGCSVHLVPVEKVDAVKEKWTNEYYKKRFPDITEEKLSEAIVVSKPGSGGCVFEVNGRESL